MKQIPCEPDNPEIRLLRAIFGQCPDCDHPELEHYDGDDYGQTHHCHICEMP